MNNPEKTKTRRVKVHLVMQQLTMSKEETRTVYVAGRISVYYTDVLRRRTYLLISGKNQSTLRKSGRKSKHYKYSGGYSTIH